MITSITGDRIGFKNIEIDDLEKIYIWKNDFELDSLVMSHPLPVSKKEVEDWLKNNQSDKHQVLFGIFLLESQQCLGIVRLMFIDWIGSTADLGIYIGTKELRGQGIGQETVRLILNYAFKGLNLHKVCLRVLESNLNAIRCYQVCGFVQEGLLRQQYWVNGKYENVILMGILKSEFK
ncbi:GNAT family N-acetyltransferase [Scytonema sp. UIC 10036]|uniref:GNAT family N-acetyltransferase n=1 Tax=Scytonema sp. UIC 10036 TaxID=2304196 RepID=UPI0012DA42EE|nr:GNAT family protein [Scytonema sp. UIC 10036]MUG97022.1 GNAT family N-acetyltransferase [Scytonema sp. UIC 10036]